MIDVAHGMCSTSLRNGQKVNHIQSAAQVGDFKMRLAQFLGIGRFQPDPYGKWR